MKMLGLVRCTVIMLATLIISHAAFATNIDRIIVFGDSLSDNGNTWIKSKWLPGPTIPKSPPYYQGRFSNGPVWVETLAAAMNLSLDPKKEEFLNYAYGGAWVEPYEDSHQRFPFSVDTQMDFYYGQYFTDSKTANHLYVLWAGANDYMPQDHASLRKDPEAATSKTVAILKKDIHWLITVYNAKNLLVLNIPDLTIVPGMVALGADDAKAVGDMAALHNKKLAHALEEEIADHPDVKLIGIDVNEDFANVRNHPETLGIKNTTDACYTGSMFGRAMVNAANSNEIQEAKKSGFDVMNNITLRTAYLNGLYAAEQCEKPDEYLYWDAVHPTQVIHQYVATMALKILGDNDIYGKAVS